MIIMSSPVFWILLIMGFGALFIFLERYFELRRGQIDWQDFINGVINVLDRDNDEEALNICDDTHAPVANVVAVAIKNRHSSARVLREAVDSQGRAEAARLDRRLASIAIIGQIAPAIGLLGTIFGFIKAVLAVNSEVIVSRPDLINASMGALISAALGLMVSIPALVMYSMLNIRMNRLIAELEVAASRIVGYISTKEAQK